MEPQRGKDSRRVPNVHVPPLVIVQMLRAAPDRIECGGRARTEVPLAWQWSYAMLVRHHGPGARDVDRPKPGLLLHA